MIELYKGLRILSNLGKNQYLVTDYDNNISGLSYDTLFNNISNTFTRQTWVCAKNALVKLYTESLPEVYQNLVDDEDIDGLNKLNKMLEKSIVGLNHLKGNYSYYSTHSDVIIYIETVLEDYCKEYIKKIKKLDLP